jgi:hypothetical protein
MPAMSDARRCFVREAVVVAVVAAVVEVADVVVVGKGYFK